MTLTTQKLFEGDKYNIYEVLVDGKSTLKGFFKKLDRQLKADLIKLIEIIAENGTPQNETKFKFEEDKIFAIKQGQARIYCFFDENKIILLTNGAIKKQQKANPQALKKAKNIRKKYIKWKENKK